MNWIFAIKPIARTVVAAALAMGGASIASATTITATYTGTVKSAFDSPGAFGTPNANLAGAAYKLVFTIDTALGSYSTFTGTITDPILSGDQVFGGMSAVLSINGHDRSFSGTSNNYDIAAHKPGFGQVVQQVGSGFSATVFASFRSTSPGPEFPTSVLSSTTVSSCPTGSCLATLMFLIPLSGSGVQGFLNFGSFTSSSAVATTPIPAALPLLVSALGGLGFVGWRRRRQAAA